MTDTLVSATGRFVRSPGFKFFTLGVLSLLLLIPASLVWLLVSEREDRARDVADEIAGIWGGAQALTGPFIVVPYEVEVTTLEDERESIRTVLREAVFLPETLDVSVSARSEVRSRGIFDVPVYAADLTLTGQFGTLSPRSVTADAARFLWGEARFALGISSVRAIRNAVVLDINGDTRAFEPSLGTSSAGALAISQQSSGRPSTALGQGIHVPGLFSGAPEPFEFTINLELNGSRALHIAPAARDTRATITSDWPHPSFTGSALPSSSEISTDGFGASWQVPHLGRSVPLAFTLTGNGFLQQLAHDQFGVRFFQPVDYYASVDRALKYAIVFIGVVFMAVFVMEVRTGRAVHVVQYVFVGLALVLFYILLLSIAEHLGFAPAYVIAASATATLIGAYCAQSLGGVRHGLVVAALLGSVFGVLYLFLQLEDFALLAGSVFAFAVLALTMFSTQSIDWSGGIKSKTADASHTRP